MDAAKNIVRLNLSNYGHFKGNNFVMNYSSLIRKMCQAHYVQLVPISFPTSGYQQSIAKLSRSSQNLWTSPVQKLQDAVSYPS